MSLDQLREWHAHRRFVISMRHANDSRGLDELHAEAIAMDKLTATRATARFVDYDAEMKLPAGKTCGDCHHIKRCRAFGFTSSEANTSCDFHPNRFADQGFKNDGWRMSALTLVREVSR